MANANEFRYVFVPPSVLKNWKDNGTALKAVGVDPKTPHTVSHANTSKGKDEDKGKRETEYDDWAAYDKSDFVNPMSESFDTETDVGGRNAT